MSGCVDSTTIPNDVLSDLVEQLSGNELKVMLYLALQTGGFSASADAIRIREIAAGTKLSKKEVRVAIRVLTINAAFSGRFQITDSSARFSSPGRPTADSVLIVGTTVS